MHLTFLIWEYSQPLMIQVACKLVSIQCCWTHCQSTPCYGEASLGIHHAYALRISCELCYVLKGVDVGEAVV